MWILLCLESFMKYIFKFIKYFIVVLLVVLLIFFLYSLYLKNTKTPKKNANWEFGQEKTAQVFFNNDKVNIKNLRDFHWEEKNNTEKTNWKDVEFSLSDIIGLKMGVSHFSVHSGIAHVFVVFEIKNGENIALSIESRREVGEDFSLKNGLTYEYENIYILATEKDLLDLRKIRNEKIYLYPIKTSPKKAQKLFLQISEKVNKLNKNPEFYHLFFNNCTNQIANEVEKFSDIKFPFIEKTFLPGNSDKALFEMGLINTDKTDFEQVQKDFLVKF